MSILLNELAFDHARDLIQKGLVKKESNWIEERPSAAKENQLLTHYGLDEYEKWFLGVNTEKQEGSKDYYVYPIGDFTMVHTSALEEIEKEASHNHQDDIAKTARILLDMVD